MNEDHYNALKNIIKVYLPDGVTTEAIKPSSHLINELNINSANLVDVVLDVEDHFDITITDEEIEKMDTVENSLKIISSKIA